MLTQTMIRSSSRQSAHHVPLPIPEMNSHSLGTSIELVGALDAIRAQRRDLRRKRAGRIPL